MPQVIDDMPTLTQVENASAHEIVAWHLFLRPTMSNEELPTVKLIAARYDRMSPDTRERITARLRAS